MTDKPQFVGKKVKLGELCEICSGGTPKRSVAEYWKDGTIPWVKIGDMSEKYVSSTEERITDAGFNNSSVKMLEPGTLLYSIFASIGAVSILKIPATTNQAIAGLKIKDDSLDRDFLYHYLKSRESISKSSGRGAAQNNINLTILRNMQVTLPSIEIQRSIVRNLEMISNQVTIAESHLMDLDALVKSRFVEIFGDFACYETKPLIKCVDCIEAGKSPKCLAFSRKMAEPGVLKLSAISSGVYCENENKALPRSVSLTIDKVVHANDILLSRKNTPELVGRSVLVKHTDGNIMFPDIIFRMHPLPPINAMYLSYLLAGPLLHSIQSLAHGSAKSMSNIPKSELAKLSIPIPALNLQNEFANFVSQVDKSRFGGMLHLLNSLSGIMHASFFSVADTD
ncbi:restriction endonuclease subunit S [Bifidobacterium adolescentis]|uniref:Restriction endonuclease subunit S n=1 Tax=Bifidobacterium adolescentis TaxID=1680 RepID=A0A7J5N8C5_BIFAD|nr:restriction endonuclease subunit S [Bifidobacterium adolescentis]KAB5843097.1 restriction endonuclease subunit S [Bifidobacterium adolescentis]KAB5855245.1 restriction endonuclease subunit S [Bifidobacterium adolescentis]KAB5855924.1 restriction endonuclease subunit S [Bifidobacterium adolescentis]KAB5873614.1 restriction endonuclease subunit S [Bifidobacterium adolescentis]